MRAPTDSRVEPDSHDAKAATDDRSRRVLLAALYGSLGLGVAVASWRYTRMLDYSSLDDSWIIGLYLARLRGLQSGRDLVFTYGPLGFLEHPRLLFGRWGLLSLAVNLGALTAVAIGMARSWSRTIPAWVAWPLTYLVLTAATWNVEVFVAAAVMLILHLALRAVDQSRLLTIAVAVGGGVVPLVKLSVAPIVVGLVVVTAFVAAPWGRWRSILITLAISTGSLLVVWILLEQSLGTLPSFVTGSVSLTSGYAGAMALEVPALGWQYGAALVTAVAVLMAWHRRTRGEERWNRWACLALVALSLGVLFRAGFVRHDPRHAFTYFSACLLLAAVPPPLRETSQRRVAGALAAMVVLVPALLVLNSIDDNLGPATLLDGPARAAGMPSAVREARSSTQRAASRAWAKGTARVPKSLIERIGDESVHIDPWNVSIAWALDLNWRPTPVFQTYAAYTPELDALNAEFMVDRGPHFVLVQEAGAIDGRFLLWESPRYRRALLCHYDTVGRGDGWELLERLPATRCGPLERIEVHHHVDQMAEVPKRGQDVILMTTTCRRSLWEQLRTLVFKPSHEVFAVTDDGRYRVSSSLLDSPMIVRRSASGFDRIGFEGCAVAPDVTFYRMPLTPAP